MSPTCAVPPSAVPSVADAHACGTPRRELDVVAAYEAR